MDKIWVDLRLSTLFKSGEEQIHGGHGWEVLHLLDVVQAHDVSDVLETYIRFSCNWFIFMIQVCETRSKLFDHLLIVHEQHRNFQEQYTIYSTEKNTKYTTIYYTCSWRFLISNRLEQL